MERSEILNIVAAFIILSLVFSFAFIIKADWKQVGIVAIFSAIILFVAILSKKLMAYWLDADVQHEVWKFSRYGWSPSAHLKKEIPGGIILPLIFSIITLGLVKFPSVLTFETCPSKYRSAKRFGYYSFTAMTDWHNAIIASAGMISLFIIAIVAYFPGYELLSKFAVYYAVVNMLPISKSDGNQIFFGSRVLYAVMSVITVIFLVYALWI